MKVIRLDGIDTYSCMPDEARDGRNVALKQEVIYWHDVQMYSFYQE